MKNQVKKLLSALLIIGLLTSPAYANNKYFTKPLPGSQIDWGHPLSRGLVFCVLMNEKGGGYIKDLVNARIGTFSGSVSWVNNDTYYNGLNMSIKFTTHSKTADLPLRDFSIITSFCWTSEVSGRIIDKRTAKGWYFGANDYSAGGEDKQLDFYSDNYSTYARALGANGTCPLKTWITCAAIFKISSKKMSIFLSGKEITYAVQQVGSGTYTSDNTIAEYIGNDHNTTSDFNGYIKYIYIYNRALSPQEIQQLYIDPYCFIKQNYYMYAPAVTPPSVSFGGQVIWLDGMNVN